MPRKTLTQALWELPYLYKLGEGKRDPNGKYAIGDGSESVADSFIQDVLEIIEDYYPPPHVCPSCKRPLEVEEIGQVQTSEQEVARHESIREAIQKEDGV